MLDRGGRVLPGAVYEKLFIDVNGTRQGMFLRGKDITNPVLLYLHGGLPEYFLTERRPTALEDCFTVAWWDQRGAGLSYSPLLPRDSITTEQCILDTVSVTHYLQERFGQERIYLMAHSGGSFIGLQVASRHPELYSGYIGMAQMVDQLRSERLAYEFMVAEFEKRDDRRMVKRLAAAPVSEAHGTPKRYLAVRDKAMHRLGVGTTHDMRSVVTGVFLPSLASPQYSVPEKIRLWRGKVAGGVSPFWDDMLSTDLAERVPSLEVPSYFLHGAFDRTCSYDLARDYFQKIQAPVKGFYTFELSAHTPIFEEIPMSSRGDGAGSLGRAARL
ncbi:MAG: alpha/beta hydrolase [Actinomycetales bacterium]|nr:alpha/beta hydrolase [Actinomycetales bacterium]